ncbi:MAG TPA: phospholipid carrier-dependent glycosyltransferase, partial [Nitrospirota bacterium]
TLSCVFFCFMLGSRPLSVPDEGRYVEIPREMVATGDYLTPRLNGVKYFEKPALFYWLEAFSIKLFGLDEFTLRLWPALFALSGCLVVSAAGARLFGRLSGLLAATALATSFLYYAMSRAIILDMPVTVFLTAALLSFLVSIREAGPARRLYLWSFYAFSALAVLTKGLIGVLIPALVIGAWIILLGEWRTLKSMELPAGIAIFLLIAAPWHILITRANPDFFHFYFIQEHFLRYLTKMHGRYQPPWFFIPIVLLGLFPWSAFLLQSIKHSLPSSWQERHEHRDAVFLMLWALLVFLFFSASDSKLVPYILPVLPPLSLLIGRYLAAAWDRDRLAFPGVRAGYVVAFAILLLLAGAFLALPVVRQAPNALSLGPYRYSFAVTLAAGGLAAWALARYRNFRQAFAALAVTSMIFLVQANAAAARVDTKSVKPLAVALKPLLKPGDEVASYRKYYQDLPVYLERRITVVDWHGELDFGAAAEDTSQWMITGDEFWKRWQGPATMYMITDIETYDSLRKDPAIVLFPVARDQRDILVANREVKP